MQPFEVPLLGNENIRMLIRMLDGRQMSTGPGGNVEEMAFTIDLLSEVRKFVSGRAARAGLRGQRRVDAVVAANELATNSVRHAGGAGSLRVWRENAALVCEVRDAGHIKDPRAGRKRPAPDQRAGRGLWIVNQLCDLVQIRSSPAGTAVRIHIALI